MARPVLDVALFSNVGVHSAPAGTLVAHPPLKCEVALGQGVSDGPIPKNVADYVFDLTSPHGLKTKPVRQFHALYAFKRPDDADATGLEWDPQRCIEQAIALSRLVHPTSVSLEDTARLFLSPDGENVDEAVVGPIGDARAKAYVSETSRNWLTEDDATRLSGVVDAFYESEETRPERITRALRFHEYAAQSLNLELRWVLVVTALEALINVEETRKRQQFRTRTLGLAEACSVAWTDDDAKEAYRLRSKLTHGQHVNDVGVAGHDLYCRMEEVLRVALRNGILDPGFADAFADDSCITSRWPIP